MFGVGRDLCGSSSPIPCRNRVTYSRLHRTASRRVLNISREEDGIILSIKCIDCCYFQAGHRELVGRSVLEVQEEN